MCIFIDPAMYSNSTICSTSSRAVGAESVTNHGKRFIAGYSSNGIRVEQRGPRGVEGLDSLAPSTPPRQPIYAPSSKCKITGTYSLTNMCC